MNLNIYIYDDHLFVCTFFTMMLVSLEYECNLFPFRESILKALRLIILTAGSKMSETIRKSLIESLVVLLGSNEVIAPFSQTLVDFMFCKLSICVYSFLEPFPFLSLQRFLSFSIMLFTPSLTVTPYCMASKLKIGQSLRWS